MALARDIHEVREARRLRYRVFARELSARVSGREEGIDCNHVLKFHSSLLQAAVLEEAALHPVAIRYARRDGTGCEEAAYEGGRSLWRSLALVTAQPEIRAELEFLPPLECRGRHRRELAQAARGFTARSLSLPAPGSPAGTAGGPRAAAR